MPKTSPIDVVVNGEPRQVPSGRSVEQLLEDLEIARERVAVELNKAIVRKRDWPAKIIAAGSQIEIVEFVGGG
ncbi:MAG: sulfur carrier protein ThiS [Bryobacteraceae bacterium]